MRVEKIKKEQLGMDSRLEEVEYNARQGEMIVRCRGLDDWYYGCWCHTDSRLTLACLRVRHTLGEILIP